MFAKQKKGSMAKNTAMSGSGSLNRHFAGKKLNVLKNAGKSLKTSSLKKQKRYATMLKNQTPDWSR